MKQYKVIFNILKESWNIDKKFFLYLFLGAILQAAISIVSMYIPATLVDMVQTGNKFIDIVYMIVIFVISTYLLKQILGYVNVLIDKNATYQAEMLKAKLSEKSMSLKYKELEDTETLDLIQRAEMPISWGYFYWALNVVQQIIIALVTILGVVSILFAYNIIYTIVILLILIISSVIRVKVQMNLERVMQESVPVNRKYGYLFGISFNPEYQKEMRVFNLSDIINKKVKTFNKGILKWTKEITIQDSNIRIFETISSTLIMFIAISYNSLRVLTDKFGDRISVGKFTLIYSSTNTIMQNVQIISENISKLNTLRVHLTPWDDFINLEEEKYQGNLIADEFNSLEFRNVSFTYPNSDKIILDDVSFKINKGEKISIVGLNNAGKSTIVKLISRFYFPQSGEILWNGKNIEEYEINSYIDQISVVFQDFKLMPYTIYENILPDMNDKEKAEDSLKEVNIFDEVSKLEKGMDTYLDKSLEESATKFSGGQNQKLAIVRALNKGGSLMILDEPTAALDPIAESEIFENFATLTKGKTSIFISHRMSSSTFSDKVLLLDGGKIVGYDSHKNLMKSHNLYRDLFETQAKNYI
ncbi:ABC transporter ATP-binding protein [Helcococcus kunzii]|uniref:ABC transporter ATP-binding protein n=1 Tax=Helcococcus kunzii TaxID=40091 RepID=UPI001BAEC3FD|nr:ABC transporter ATP-binding protein [Helcococcus kunzii]QUY64406.1 ABC transporter ATP-binding protein [Helcococcus kunzii]